MEIIRFPGEHRHARASAGSRAANRAKSSAVTPCDRATSVEITADHHSAGMLSLLNHLITAQFPAPTSAAMPSREGQRSMISLNEAKSDMTENMGQAVPKIKAMVSHDYSSEPGHLVPNMQDDEKIAETVWREQFRQRVRAAQGSRTQQDMADLLGISRDSYAKYVGGRGSVMPVRLLPKFAKICGVDLLDLIEGSKAVKQPATRSFAKPKRKAG
jgi:hypothetical protein